MQCCFNSTVFYFPCAHSVAEDKAGLTSACNIGYAGAGVCGLSSAVF